MQAAEETKKRLFPIQAARMATASAAHAEMGFPVAGHNSQCHIRNIIKKRTKCYVFDFFPNQGQREDTDQCGDAYHDCNIKKDIILHLQNPP